MTAETPLQANPRSPSAWAQEFFYDALYCLSSIVMGMLFPTRVSGGNCVPRDGGFLVVANHLSYIDPPLLGMTCYRRRLGYLAKAPLFRFAPFRWWILALGAIKIDQENSAKGGIQATLKAVAEGKGVALFPEGGRSEDGELQPLQRGILLLVRRAKCPVVVAGIAGAYEAWPIFNLLPAPKPMWVHYDTWNRPAGASDEEALADLARAMAAARAKARRGWRSMNGIPRRWKPAAGSGG
ncbi:MAG TPA: lysophospholipid acyltransferase family protein [Planctomycetia bacterium]|nr:lysophospholipid acyltransferase family protein [Planctomycetia bacterium]